MCTGTKSFIMMHSINVRCAQTWQFFFYMQHGIEMCAVTDLYATLHALCFWLEALSEKGGLSSGAVCTFWGWYILFCGVLLPAASAATAADVRG